MFMVHNQNVIVECLHHQHAGGAHHKHLVQDGECRSEYDAYYDNTHGNSWVTYDFKGEQVKLAGVGFGSGTCDWTFQPEEVRVLAYGSNRDADSEAFELGSWKLTYNNEYRSTEKFALE